MSNDPCDPEPLTPNHFLLGRTSPNLPPDIFQELDILSAKHWRHAQAIALHFWLRWMKEYLPTLTERRNWTTPQRNLREGDVDAIFDPDNSRGTWKLARVQKTKPSPDGIVRSAIVQTATLKDDKETVIKTDYHRPVHKLCLILPDDGDGPLDGTKAGHVPVCGFLNPQSKNRATQPGGRNGGKSTHQPSGYEGGVS